MEPITKHVPELDKFANDCMQQYIPASQHTQEFAGSYLCELGLQKEPAFPFRFDTIAAHQALNFLKPMQLSQLEQLKVWVWAGWLRKSDGSRRFADDKGF